MNALILVDIQKDFLPGGALAVPHGDEVVPVANRVQSNFDLIVATQDWHPPNHSSFAVNHEHRVPGDVVQLAGILQTLWSVHCVQGTAGAEFADGLDISRLKQIFRKGSDSQVDSYSGFFDNGRQRDTGLGDYLRQQQVAAVYVLGLATDYCIKFTVLDACHLGFQTYVIEDGCRGIDRQPGDVSRAWQEMRAAGAQVVTSTRLSGRDQQ